MQYWVGQLLQMPQGEAMVMQECEFHVLQKPQKAAMVRQQWERQLVQLWL